MKVNGPPDGSRVRDRHRVKGVACDGRRPMKIQVVRKKGVHIIMSVPKTRKSKIRENSDEAKGTGSAGACRNGSGKPAGYESFPLHEGGLGLDGESSPRLVLAQNGMNATRPAICYRTIIYTDSATK